MAEITPQFITDFQRNLNVRFSNSWKGTLANLWWQNVAIRQSSSSLAEMYEWMLETAVIESTGSKGTEANFHDLVAISHQIENENWGSFLKLGRNSIEDNKYDRAAKWSADAGSAGAYFPQRTVIELIQNGTTEDGYDGVPFFDENHPVNPFDDTLGVYSNLHTAKPLTASNLAEIVGRILSIKHPGDAPRNRMPSMLLVPPDLTYAAQQITGAEIIASPDASPAGISNMIKRAYTFGQPITVPEFADEPGVYYVGVPADEDALEGAFIYQERKAFELTSYTGMTQAELDRLMEFEWHMRGRSTGAYGHPYLFHRVEPA